MVTTIVGIGRGLAKYPLDSILDIGGFVTNKRKTPSYKCNPTKPSVFFASNIAIKIRPLPHIAVL